jgi:long-chain acyl-CoA synthetase
VESAAANFCRRVAAASSARPDKVAMTMLSPTGSEDITFASALKRLRSVAYRLGREGVAFGDRVALIGENHPDWAIAYLGILYRGAVVTPLDPASTPETLALFLTDSETKLAFVSPASLGKFRDACAQMARTIPAVLLQSSGHDRGPSRVEASFGDWASTPVPEEFVTAPPPAGPADLALLMYTSGTTGRPKAVPLTHGNIQAQIDAVQEVMRITEREVVLSILPLFHAYSQVVNLWLAATIGARVVYLNQFGSAEVEAGLKRCGATTLTGVPRLWYLFHQKVFDAVNAKPAPLGWAFRALLLANGVLRDYARVNAGRVFFGPIHQAFGGRLRLAVSGGATFDEAVAKDFHRLGFTILQGYGLTETSGAVTVTRFEDNIIGSVGTPLNGVEVKIDEPNEAGVGEVLIRGPIVTAGYYRNPEADDEAFTPDRWFRSGDLGHFGRGGHLYIVGRKKDVIVLPSGKNVFPEDVEAHYERSPLVGEICVLGRHDAGSRFEGAESLCAVVVPNFEFLKAQRISNPGEWIPWELEDLGRELPEYQRVHDFVIRTEPLPRTTTRKIRRHELRQQMEAANPFGTNGRNGNGFALHPADHDLMNSPAGVVVAAAVSEHVAEAIDIHPRLNLEIDLRLDSLARVECITSVEQALGIRFGTEEATSILTVGDLVELAGRKMSGEGASSPAPPITAEAARALPPPAKFYWREVLTDTPANISELRPLLNRKPLITFMVCLLMRLIYFGARVTLGVEVKGGAVLKRLEPPYLLCPNHQSYLDPFLVCSILPPDALSRVIHVGASRYFTGFVMSRLARLINVVPINPDTHLVGAMRAGAAALRAGRILNVYPEGRRSFDGQLGVFKKGAAILAAELNVPIVPVALDGTFRIWPRRSSRIGRAKVKLSFGEPIDAREVTAGDMNDEQRYERITALLRERVGHMLAELRER